MLTALNDKLMVGGIFCDLQKVFDCVNHQILKGKLEFYRIQGKFSSLVKSYLTGRFQRVILGNFGLGEKSSNWKQIKNGVPQGSILGPLLFLIYINDLPKVLDGNSHTVLYADDTSILIMGLNKRDLEENSNLTFQKIIKWFNSNRLTLNLNKTQFLEVKLKHSPNDGIKIKYEQMHVNNATEVSFLGLILEDSLSWKKHTKYVTGKLCSACYVLWKIRAVVSQDTLKTIYFAHFHSILSYGIILGAILHMQKRYL